jgi:thymidylate synthase
MQHHTERTQLLFVEDLREEFARLRKAGKTVGNTIELIGESFVANDETIFGSPNYEYIERELDWYLSGSLNVNDIPGGAPAIWKKIASANHEINSNYGHLLLSEDNGFQLDQVVTHLIQDPETRRATAVYTRPTIHRDWNRDGMQDFICTNAVQYLIRDGKLDLVVQMRSNDIVFGYRNDRAWHEWTQLTVIQDLAENGVLVEPGNIYWNAASLHIYERHFWILDHYIATGQWLVDVNGAKP